MPLQISSEIEKALEEMPTISPVVNKLASMARDIEVAPRDLVKVIMMDPVLSAKVIKLVNSSFFGFSERIQSLAQAVILLGVNTVKNMAMATAVLEKFLVKTQRLPMDPDLFWKHCLATAVTSKMLARIQNVPANEQETYFLAGLLHDVGKVIFMKSIPEEYGLALQESRRLEVSLTFTEMAYFGCAHSHVGGMLARKWKLDQVFIDVIEHHHAFDVVPHESPIVRTVMVANNLCKQAQIGEGGNPVVEELTEEVQVGLGVDAPQAQNAMVQLPEELKKAVQFLQVAKERV